MEEVILDPGPLGLGDVAAVDQHDADVGQDVAQVAPDRLLVLGEPRHRLVDHVQLLERRAAVGAAFGDAFADLGLDAGDADHEEFIKVIGRNRQESHPLQRGMAGIDGFLQHPAIEMQPGKFPIDEAFGAGGDRWRALGFRLFLFNYNGLCGFHQEFSPSQSAGLRIVGQMHRKPCDIAMTFQ